MKFNLSAGALAFAISVLAAGAGHAAEIRVSPADGTEKLIETFIMVEEGDTILLGAGRWDLADGLVLDADGVTVRGAGAGETVLSFKGQTGSGEGLLVTSDNVVLEDFAVEDTK
ncbi:MAG: hypothetical protein RIF44_19505, partial [Nitratireductor sp.]